MSRFGSLGTQYLDDAGNPLIDGLIYFYASGTTTKITTYSDINLTIANSNPVVLTGAGRQPNIFFAGSARAVLTKADYTQVEVRDPVGQDSSSSQFTLWLAEAIYNKYNIVLASDNRYYQSIIGSNIGNPPPTTAGAWAEISITKKWNINETYETDDIVLGAAGALSRSTINSNVGNDPDTDFTNWASAAGIPALAGNSLLPLRVNVGETGIEFGDVFPTQVAQSGKFLTTNGTTKSWGVPVLDYALLYPATTLSADTYVDFVLTAGYTTYIVELNNIVTSSELDLWIRTSSNGGSTFDAGTSYYFLMMYHSSLAAAPSGSSGVSQPEIKLSQLSPAESSCTITICDPQASKKTFIHWGLSSYKTGGGNAINSVYGSGFRNSAGVVNAIRILPSGGTLTSGTIKVYGVR